MTVVVVSQPFYFPWVGMLEQIRLAQVYVHYDDVQFSRGSFVNRVQLKTSEGPRWLTVPTEAFRLGQPIREVRVSRRLPWARDHLRGLRQAYAAAPFRDDALRLMEEVLDRHDGTLGGVARASVMALARYFGLDGGRRFVDVATLDVPGRSSERVRDVVRAVGGTAYVTGHGARRYLDHALLEAAGIAVRYMDYRRAPYPQLHGAFDPHVTGLDLVANCGREGLAWIASDTVGWREFVARAA